MRASADANSRFHRIVGNYLAGYAWRHNADCVRISGMVLKWILERQRMKGAGLKQFKEDVRFWFPFCHAHWKTTSSGFTGKVGKTLLFVYFSRTEIMKDGKVDPDLRTVNFQIEQAVGLSETEILTYLMLLASGQEPTIKE